MLKHIKLRKVPAWVAASNPISYSDANKVEAEKGLFP